MYRAGLPVPQVGVFLRCAGLAGEAFFTLADRARPEIEPLLRAELGPDLAMEWGTSHHPGMTDIAAKWNCFASLAGGLEANDASPAERERHAPAKDGFGERSG